MKALIPVVLLAPSLAMASLPCDHESLSELQLDLQDIRTLQVAIGADKLRLTGSPSGDGRLDVRACASSGERLERMSLAVERTDDGVLKLVREVGGSSSVSFNFFGRGRGNYGYFQIDGAVPEDLAIELTVGSGDAWIHDVRELDAIVGSGDVEAQGIGLLKAQVGSGDIVAESIGRVEIRSIGSGDIKVKKVAGDVSVGSIGSGDLVLVDVDGSVEIGSIGSGDAKLDKVGGNVSVGSLGSGDVDAKQVGGDLVVRAKGSGDVSHRQVAGTVDVPSRR